MARPYRILFPLAISGHDPTEVAIPYKYFVNNSKRECHVTFATADGTSPQADRQMLEGMTGAMLGATAEAKEAYRSLSTESELWLKPVSWRDPGFSITDYDCVFLPGGHEKGVRSIIEDETIHEHLRAFFALTGRNRTVDTGEEKKTVAAICHGVQVLAFTAATDSPLKQFPLEQFHQTKVAETDGKKFKSVIHACKTTALPGFMEKSVYNLTSSLLGDYYKTFGAGTPTVEEYVTATLDDPQQFNAGPSWWNVMQVNSPFVVEDPNMRYVSARFPPDAQKLAERVIELSLEA